MPLRRLGYVPSTSAVSLATGRTQNIGVVMPYVNRWFFAEVLEGIQQALLERGLDLTLYDAKPGSDGSRTGSSGTSWAASDSTD